MEIEDLYGQLEGFTVKELREIKRDYGVRKSARRKNELIQLLMDNMEPEELLHEISNRKGIDISLLSTETQAEHGDYLSTLPFEVLYIVMEKMDVGEIISLCRSSKYFRETCKNEYIVKLIKSKQPIQIIKGTVTPKDYILEFPYGTIRFLRFSEYTEDEDFAKILRNLQVEKGFEKQLSDDVSITKTPGEEVATFIHSGITIDVPLSKAITIFDILKSIQDRSTRSARSILTFSISPSGIVRYNTNLQSMLTRRMRRR